MNKLNRTLGRPCKPLKTMHLDNDMVSLKTKANQAEDILMELIEAHIKCIDKERPLSSDDSFTWAHVLQVMMKIPFEDEAVKERWNSLSSEDKLEHIDWLKGSFRADPNIGMLYHTYGIMLGETEGERVFGKPREGDYGL